jgi:hypothetical protein
VDFVQMKWVMIRMSSSVRALVSMVSLNLHWND